jgi:hypothetical protein
VKRSGVQGRGVDICVSVGLIGAHTGWLCLSWCSEFDERGALHGKPFLRTRNRKKPSQGATYLSSLFTVSTLSRRHVCAQEKRAGQHSSGVTPCTPLQPPSEAGGPVRVGVCNGCRVT